MCVCRLRLEKLHAEEMEQLKTKALGQLKDLGNMFLKNFGMSVDDFKMQQDPKSGGWNIRWESSLHTLIVFFLL